MEIKQYIHVPRGSGSYTVAENLHKHVQGIGRVWAVGDHTSGIYVDGVHAIRNIPSSQKKVLAELSQEEYSAYCASISEALQREENNEYPVLAHHGLMLAPLLSEKRHVLTLLHGSEMLTLEEGMPTYIEEHFRDGVRDSKVVFVMSDKQKKSAEILFSQELQQEVYILGGGVDPSLFYPRDDKENMQQKYGIDPKKKTILYGGRICPEKELDTLLAAFTDKNFAQGKQLVLVGSGSLKGDLQGKAIQEEIDAVFIPHVQQDELARLMSAADIFTLTSSYESFGLVCIEALACGTPVVASDVGILPQLVSPPEGGRIFERNETKHVTIRNLQHAIESELSGPSPIARYGEHVRTTYSWDQVSHRFQERITKIR